MSEFTFRGILGSFELDPGAGPPRGSGRRAGCVAVVSSDAGPLLPALSCRGEGRGAVGLREKPTGGVNGDGSGDKLLWAGAWLPTPSRCDPSSGSGGVGLRKVRHRNV